MGYTTEHYGKTVGVFMNELLMWVGIDELIFDVNYSCVGDGCSSHISGWTWLLWFLFLILFLCQGLLMKVLRVLF